MTISKIVTLSDLVYLCYPAVPLSWLYAMARAHGSWLYLTKRRSAAALRANLGGVRPEWNATEVRAAAHRFFQYRNLRNLQFVLAPKLTDQQLERAVALDGLERLDRAIAASANGVILLTGHLNSLSTFLLVFLLRRRGYDIRVPLVSEQDNWSSSWVRTTFNRLTGDRTYFQQLGAFHCVFNIRPIVRALGERAVLFQTGDGWHSAGFVEVEFLGRQLPFTTGMLRIAQQTGATVVPVFATGTPPDHLHFVLEEPFTVPKDEPIDVKVGAFARQLEHHVRANVECWEHWLVPDTLQTIANWSRQSLERRYAST